MQGRQHYKGSQTPGGAWYVNCVHWGVISEVYIISEHQILHFMSFTEYQSCLKKLFKRRYLFKMHLRFLMYR